MFMGNLDVNVVRMPIKYEFKTEEDDLSIFLF